MAGIRTVTDLDATFALASNARAAVRLALSSDCCRAEALAAGPEMPTGAAEADLALEYIGKARTPLLSVLNGGQTEADTYLEKENFCGVCETFALRLRAAFSRALAAIHSQMLGAEPYRHFGNMAGGSAGILPLPRFAIMSGGSQSDNTLDMDAYGVLPIGAASFSCACRMAADVWVSLGDILSHRAFYTSVGHEGAYAPDVSREDEVCEQLMYAMEKRGYVPGRDFGLFMSVPADRLYMPPEGFFFWKSDRLMSDAEYIGYWAGLVKKYPIFSLENAIPSGYEPFRRLAFQGLGNRCELAGGYGSARLIPVDQTISALLCAVSACQKEGKEPILYLQGALCGETLPADIAVGLGFGQIRFGSPFLWQHLPVINRLIKIEAELGQVARFAGRGPFSNVPQDVFKPKSSYWNLFAEEDGACVRE